eukprot:jgi/Orpsp1_1/1178012/evm.model.c7180000063721.1
MPISGIFIQVELWIQIPSTGENKEISAILDTGSSVNMVNEDLAYEWEIPLLPSRTKIVFPHQEEVSRNITQEMIISMRLPNDKGIVVTRKQGLRFTFSKNIPYGCLLGIYALYDLRVGFRFTSKGYQPYFSDEEITIMDQSLLIEDLQADKVSFVSIEEISTTLDLRKLPREYHEYSSIFCQQSNSTLPPHRPGFD